MIEPLKHLNTVDVEQAKHAFLQCCTSIVWVEKMVSSRPYNSEEQLRNVADKHWRGLNEADYLEAFEGHPKIGDVNSLRAKYANTKALASGEQSSVAHADESTLTALAQGNSEYETRFGFIFIVCATGKSANEMLALLQTRLPNRREQEIVNAAEEQRKIFQIRLNKLLEE